MVDAWVNGLLTWLLFLVGEECLRATMTVWTVWPSTLTNKMKIKNVMWGAAEWASKVSPSANLRRPLA